MKDASDLRSKAKARRRDRRTNSYKDVDKVNFKSNKEYKRHVAQEMDDEKTVEMQTWKIGKKRN